MEFGGKSRIRAVIRRAGDRDDTTYGMNQLASQSRQHQAQVSDKTRTTVGMAFVQRSARLNVLTFLQSGSFGEDERP